MISYRTSLLLSSPKDKNSKPINYSHRSFPKTGAKLLNKSTATILFYSFSSSCAKFKILVKTCYPLSSSFNKRATLVKSLAAYFFTEKSSNSKNFDKIYITDFFNKS